MSLQFINERANVFRSERADDFFKMVLDADGPCNPVFTKFQEVVQVHVRKGAHE